MKRSWLAALLLTSCVTTTPPSLPLEHDFQEDIKTVKTWTPERLMDYRGRYYSGEFGSGYETLNLIGYYDYLRHAPRLAAILVTVEDVAVKPKVQTWYNLRLANGGLSLPGSNSPLFTPIIANEKDQGMAYQGIFLKRPPEK